MKTTLNDNNEIRIANLKFKFSWASPNGIEIAVHECTTKATNDYINSVYRSLAQTALQRNFYGDPYEQMSYMVIKHPTNDEHVLLLSPPRGWNGDSEWWRYGEKYIKIEVRDRYDYFDNYNDYMKKDNN